MSVKHLIAPSVLSLSLGLVACGTKKKDKSDSNTQVNSIAKGTETYKLCKEAVDAYKKAATKEEKAKIKFNAEALAFAKELIDGKYLDADMSKLSEVSKISLEDCAKVANHVVEIKSFSASASKGYPLKFVADLAVVEKLSLAGFGLSDVTYGDYNAAKTAINALDDVDAYKAALVAYIAEENAAEKKTKKATLDTATTDAVKTALKTVKLQGVDVTPESAIAILEDVKISEKEFAKTGSIYTTQELKDAYVRVPALAAIKGLKNVVKLDLANNKLSSVSDLGEFKKLTHLDVTGTNNLVDAVAGKDKLKELATKLRAEDSAVLAEVRTNHDMSAHEVADVKFSKVALKLAEEIKKGK